MRRVLLETARFAASDWLRLVILLLGVVAVGAAGAAGAAGVPQRVVSLVPAMTETVCELGACDRLVGVDRHSNWPERVRALPRLGGLDDAQVERIVALRPDLVLVSPSARIAPRLAGLGLRVIEVQADRIADMRQAIDTVAGVLGDPAAGGRLWQRIDARVDAAAARVPPAWRGRRVYFEVSSTPHAAGSVSFIGELLARLALGNVVPASLGPFPQLNPEFVLRTRPDLVMGSAAAVAGMAARPGWSGLEALRAHRTCGFTPAQMDVVVRPGPRLGEAAELIADCVAALAPEGR